MNGMFDALEFADYVRGRWPTVAIACGVAVGLAFAVSLALPKRYTATASLLIQAPGGNDPRASTAVSPVYLESLKSYESLASSDTLFEQALTAADVPERNGRASFSSLKKRVLKITKPVNTAIIEISATLGDPRKAQAVAQLIAERTVALSRSLDDRASKDLTAEFRSQVGDALARYTKAKEARAAYVVAQPVEGLQNEVDEKTELGFRLDRDLEIARTDLAEDDAPAASAKAGSGQAKIASLEGQLRDLRAALAEDARQLDERRYHRDALENEERSAEAAWETANTRMNEMLSSAEFHGERLQIVDPGIVPDQPSSPNTPLNVAGALLFSLAGSVVWLVIRFSHARLVSARAEAAQGGAGLQCPRTPMMAALLGLWAAAVALAPDPAAKLLIAGPPLGAALGWWIVLSPERWLGLFFFCAILLPPLPGPFGNAGLNVAPLFALAGLFVGALRINEWQRLRGMLPIALFVFLAVVTASVAFAGFYSGWTIAAGSLARVLLLAIGVWIFFYTLAGPRRGDADAMRFARWLFIAAGAAALFACVDFYFQLPAPAGYGAQFIWVGQEVLRRAQGLFYEASTLGNFCAFFLVMILVAAFRRSGERPCSPIALAAGGVVFAAALLLSYSRASLVTVAVAGCAFLFVRGMNIRRAAPVVCGSLLFAALLFRVCMPELSSHYWSRIELSIQYLWSSPDGVLSGRLSVWRTMAEFLVEQPWRAVFGIGYKTLPYTSLVGPNLPADNTYLSLLVETGVVGLAAFLALNAAILRASFRAARSALPRASFFGTWIFCFWCGEAVQMLSGDLITYWRVLPIYFWVLATAAREAAE